MCSSQLRLYYVSGLVLGQVLGHWVPTGSALMVISLVLLLGTLAIHTALMQLGVDLTWSVSFLSLTQSNSGCIDTSTSSNTNTGAGIDTHTSILKVLTHTELIPVPVVSSV